MLAEKCAQHGQIPFIKQTLTPAHNVLRDLAGLEPKALSPLEEFVENNILRKSNETYQLIFELQLLLDITHSFFLRDFDKAQQLAEVLVDAYEKGNQQYAFNRIICDFYVGLVACHFGRQTEDTSWLLKAKQSLKKVESVLIHSVWNFENKYQLLKAECHYTAGEISEAAKCYEESNNSARDHKFIHEHALCCEMAGHFYKDQCDQTKSQLMFNKAKDAYTEWGAVKKAETVNCID